MLLFDRRRPRLSVVVVFFNMRREAPRTLYSLTTRYQRGVRESDYEVLAIDSGSTEPLDRSTVEGMQRNFRYLYVESPWPTPCRAMNRGIAEARSGVVACSIDGARILSPGVLHSMLGLHRLDSEAFVFTAGMHLGSKRQNVSMTEGYDQAAEDRLLAGIDWESDGYRLFEISALAGSSKEGFLEPLAESNFFSVAKRHLLRLGGFDERFRLPGGGIVNLDIFNMLLGDPALEPYMLLGEASFHQFHGGVATNVPAAEHRFREYKDEYRAIRGREYETAYRPPTYFGKIPDASRPFLLPEELE